MVDRVVALSPLARPSVQPVLAPQTGLLAPLLIYFSWLEAKLREVTIEMDSNEPDWSMALLSSYLFLPSHCQPCPKLSWRAGRVCQSTLR